ncbi:hypothetical protein V6N13_039861 [Hibiscus sabdariffa]|uniref:Uncharacterized protein n=1 Tax=Hibiscus sabdariffa TaxID=183260 RepID=A0ABR2SU57_9ROSI
MHTLSSAPAEMPSVSRVDISPMCFNEDPPLVTKIESLPTQPCVAIPLSAEGSRAVHELSVCSVVPLGEASPLSAGSSMAPSSRMASTGSPNISTIPPCLSGEKYWSTMLTCIMVQPRLLL